MIMRKKFFVLALTLAVSSIADAQGVAEPAYANMQRAVGGIIQSVAQARGYTLTDPRTYGTLYSFGKAAGSTVAGVGAAGVVVGTAPGWLTLIAAAAVAAGVTYAVNASLDGLVKFMFPGNGQVVIFVPPMGVQYSSSDSWTNASPADGSCKINPSTGFADGTMVYVGKAAGSCFSIPSAAYYQRVCVSSAVQSAIGGTSCSNASSSNLAALASVLTSNGWTDNNAQTVATGSPVQTTVPNLANAVSLIPQTELAQPVDPSMLAVLINEMWREAAQQPGYAGLPYDPSQPVQVTDVAAWAAANPAAYPTVQALVAPVSDTSTGFAPSTSSAPDASVQPATQATSPTSTNSAASEPAANLGPDPGIGSPTLEPIPTASQILAPVLSLLPDLRAYSVPSHSGDCPKPSFTAWGKTFTLTEHCDFAEQNRPGLYAAGVLLFAIASLLILLSA